MNIVLMIFELKLGELIYSNNDKVNKLIKNKTVIQAIDIIKNNYHNSLLTCKYYDKNRSLKLIKNINIY